MGLFRTQRSTAAVFCRIALAAVFIPHGMDKLVRFEPFGWEGPEAWVEEFTSLFTVSYVPEHYKVLLAQISGWVEIVAALSCVLGLLVRVTMLPLMINIATAAALTTVKNGFWFTHRLDGVPAPGFEYHLVLLLIALGLLIGGAGSYSLDRFIGGDEDDYYYYDDEEDEDDYAPGPV